MESLFTGEIPSMRLRLEGYNTDAYGFETSLKPLLKRHHQKALILGDGGASRAVAYVLKKLDIKFKFVSRRAKGKQLGYEELNERVIKDRMLIINTTPVGTFPNIVHATFISYSIFPRISQPGGATSPNHFLSYNPSHSLFSGIPFAPDYKPDRTAGACQLKTDME